MEIMNPEIISRETIKPYSPIPDSKGTYKLSLLDQVTARVYVPVIFFYQNKQQQLQEGSSSSSADVAHKLKKSLSETLSRYYPLAGRIKDGATVDCKDQGAYLSVARVDSPLQQLVKHRGSWNLDKFMPDEIGTKRWDTRSLLLIQLTFFSCGGFAIGMRVAHMLVDILAISAFVNDWATVARQSGIHEISPEFTPFFPPSDSLSMPEESEFRGGHRPAVSKRRLVFDSVKLDALKTKATRSGVENPTRVEVATALIYRSAVAASRACSGFLKPSALNQIANLRKRIIPPVPEKRFGNMAWFYTIHTADESEIEFSALVGRLKAGLADFCDTYGKNFTGEELIQLMFSKNGQALLSDDQNVDKYTCTSWCRSCLYEADFGWGKPIWAGHAGFHSKNLICLNDTRDGDGIEAYVSLGEEEMAVFERDEELLQFCYFS